MWEAIIREKQIKNMKRKEKLILIRSKNPLFTDISNEVFSYVDNPLDVLTYYEWKKKNEKYYNVDSPLT
jgi:hypothetical protein